MNKYFIVLALLSLVGLSWGEDKKEPAKAYKNVNPDEFEKLAAKKDHVVLDVRTAKEFEAGHIPGAVNIDFMDKEFQKKVSALDKNKTYLVHCAGGRRSVGACEAMGKLEFRSMFNLEKGFKDWEQAGKKVEK
jgi:rhodanese-related sulfurtransferase